MGIFGGENGNSKTYQIFKIKPSEKDGKVHVIMFNIFDKFTGAGTGIVKDGSKVDLLLSCLQDDGYEIADVKLTSNDSSGITTGYCVLVTYK